MLRLLGAKSNTETMSLRHHILLLTCTCAIASDCCRYSSSTSSKRRVSRSKGAACPDTKMFSSALFPGPVNTPNAAGTGNTGIADSHSGNAGAGGQLSAPGSVYVYGGHGGYGYGTPSVPTSCYSTASSPLSQISYSDASASWAHTPPTPESSQRGRFCRRSKAIAHPCI